MKILTTCLLGAMVCMISSLSAENSRQELHKKLFINADVPAVLVKGRKVSIVITLKNPENSGRVVHYVLQSEGKEKKDSHLPAGLAVTRIGEKKTVFKSSSPPDTVFFDGVAVRVRPQVKKGLPLKPGGMIKVVVDISDIVKSLDVGSYEIRPLVWLPPGLAVESRKLIAIKIVEPK